MRFLARDGRRESRIRLIARRLNKRRIDIAALTTRLVERNVRDALARGRRRKPLGDLDLAREILLARRVRRVPELIRECIQRSAHEIHIRRLR